MYEPMPKSVSLRASIPMRGRADASCASPARPRRRAAAVVSRGVLPAEPRPRARGPADAQALRAAAASSSARSICSRERLDVARRRVERGVAADLDERLGGRGDDRRAAGHRLEHGQSEALGERRDRRRPRPPGRARAPRRARRSPPRGSCRDRASARSGGGGPPVFQPAPPASTRSGRERRAAPHALAGDDERLDVLAGLERAQIEDEGPAARVALAGAPAGGAGRRRAEERACRRRCARRAPGSPSRDSGRRGRRAVVCDTQRKRAARSTVRSQSGTKPIERPRRVPLRVRQRASGRGRSRRTGTSPRRRPDRQGRERGRRRPSGRCAGAGSTGARRSRRGGGRSGG